MYASSTLSDVAQERLALPSNHIITANAAINLNKAFAFESSVKISHKPLQFLVSTHSLLPPFLSRAYPQHAPEIQVARIISIPCVCLEHTKAYLSATERLSPYYTAVLFGVLIFLVQQYGTFALFLLNLFYVRNSALSICT